MKNVTIPVVLSSLLTINAALAGQTLEQDAKHAEAQTHEMANDVETEAEHAGDKLQHEAKEAKREVSESEAWQNTEEASEEAWEETKQATREGAHEVKEEMSEAKDEVAESEAWQDTKHATKEAWQETKEKSKEVWQDTKELSKESWKSGRAGAKDLWSDTKQASQKGWKNTKDAFNEGIMAGRLETALILNDELNPFDIDFEINEDDVTLTGTVGTDVEKELATQIAESIAGVDDVENNIVVDEKLNEQSNIDSEDKDRHFSQYMKDITTTAWVKTKLLVNDDVSGLDIDVDTYRDRITLSGAVDTEAQRALAQSIAEERDGARVVNDLRVKS